MTRVQPINGFRWTARILGIAMVGLVFTYFVGTGGFNPLKLKARETALMIPFLVAVGGLLLAWKWELAGGLLTIDGMLVFVGLNWSFSGEPPHGWAFGALTLPGFLFLICAILDKSHDRALPPAPVSTNG